MVIDTIKALPPLPEPASEHYGGVTGWQVISKSYTADQMQAYALSTIAAAQPEVDEHQIKQHSEIVGLLKEARKIIRASSVRNLVSDWDRRATAALVSVRKGNTND